MHHKAIKKALPPQWFDYATALATEFANASKIAVRIKHTFAQWADGIGGGHLSAWLVSPLIKLIRSDNRHAPGHRSAAWGDMRRLEGFEFNETYQPPAPGDMRCSLLHSSKSDQVLLKTSAFTADTFLTGQVSRATHYKAGLLVAAVPLSLWERGRLFSAFTNSMVVDCRAVPSLQLLVDLLISEMPVLYCVALSVSFFRFAGSLSVPYREGRKDLLRIVKAFCA